MDKKYQKPTAGMAWLPVLVLLTLVVGCGQGDVRLGVDIPADAEVVKLASIRENPAEYNGKKVVLKGIISGQCPSYCEFFFRDGVHKATIFPSGYKFPKLPTKRPVTVYAEVTAGAENVVFSALGVQIGKGG